MINFRSDASQISEGVILDFENEKSINAKNKKTHNVKRRRKDKRLGSKGTQP